MRFLRIAAPCLALAVVGCATRPPEATDQVRTEELQAVVNCLNAAAIKLDDGRSEASTVGLGLRPSCAAEFARSRNVYAQSMNPSAAQLFHRMDDQAFMQIATAAVLDERAKRR
jgi:hypothetical protein